jgi:hypothetical protein
MMGKRLHTSHERVNAIVLFYVGAGAGFPDTVGQNSAVEEQRLTQRAV